jgi:hypothetical protein
MRKKYLTAAILLLGAAAMVVFLRERYFPGPAENKSQTGSAGQSGIPTVSADNSGTAASVSATGAIPTQENLAANAGELPPPPPVATNIPPLIILQNARRAIVQYAQVYGGNPVGTNPEITAALMGNNPKRINFITPDSGLRVNEKGEMLDAWGTPLFFHQLSGHEMEIRSAGEDRKMWTLDDLVTR